MKIKTKNSKINKRISRHKRIRARVYGESDRPRLSVFKSNSYIYAQLIDDNKGVTIVAVSDSKMKGKTKTQRAKEAGVEIAKNAKDKKIKKVIFDRGGYLYTGRVKAFAEGARKGGLNF